MWVHVKPAVRENARRIYLDCIEFGYPQDSGSLTVGRYRRSNRYGKRSYPERPVSTDSGWPFTVPVEILRTPFHSWSISALPSGSSRNALSKWKRS